MFHDMIKNCIKRTGIIFKNEDSESNMESDQELKDDQNVFGYFKVEKDSNNSKEEELVPITDPVEFYVLMFNALLHLTPGIELTGFKENDDFSKERMMDLSKHLWKWREEDGLYTFRYRGKVEFEAGFSFMFILKVMKTDDENAVMTLDCKGLHNDTKQVDIVIPQNVD